MEDPLPEKTSIQYPRLTPGLKGTHSRSPFCPNHGARYVEAEAAEQLRGLSNSGLSLIHTLRTEYRSCATYSTKADWTQGKLRVSCVACVKCAVTGAFRKSPKAKVGISRLLQPYVKEILGNDLRMQRCVTPKPMLKHRCPEMVPKLFRLVLILIDSETADASPSET